MSMIGEDFLKQVTAQAASIVHDLTNVADAEAISAGQDLKPSMITLLGSIDLVKIVSEKMGLEWQELLRRMIIKEVNKTIDLADSMRTAILHEVTNAGDLSSVEALEVHKILAPRCVTSLIGVTGAALVRRLVSGSFALRVALGETHSRIETLRKLIGWFILTLPPFPHPSPGSLCESAFFGPPFVGFHCLVQLL